MALGTQTARQSELLVEKARKGEADSQGKLVQLWYKRIYNFQCRDELRRSKGKRTTSIERELSTNSDHFPYGWKDTLRCPFNPETHVMQDEMAEILQQALLRLPEEQRKILIMKEYERMVSLRKILQQLPDQEVPTPLIITLQKLQTWKKLTR